MKKAGSLPRMYVMSSNMASSPDSTAKTSLLQSRDSKWDTDTHELGERLLCKHTQPCELQHDDTSHVDISVQKAALDAAQSSMFNDFDMFPPLGTYLQMYKSGKSPGGANRLAEQHKVAAMKISFSECLEVCARANSPQPKVKKSFEASQGEDKSGWNIPSFWNTKGEKASFPQTSQRWETVVSLDECCAPSLLLQNNKGLKRSVKEWEMTVQREELGLNVTHKINMNEGFTKSTGSTEHGTPTKLLPGKPPLDYLLSPEKSLQQKTSSQNLHLSLENNALVNQTAGILDTCCYKYFKKSDTKHSSSAVDSVFVTSDVSGSSECTEANSFTEKCSDSPYKHTIISYLKLYLESQELQSLPSIDASPEARCLASPNCPPVDDSLREQDTTYAENSSISDEKLVAEYEKVCEEMLDHYIVISNLPRGLTRGDVLYHIQKVGIITYLIMDGSRAHVIFLKADDAKAAFGLRHELCGQELVVYRPKRPTCTLYLSGLTNNTPNEGVIQVLSEYGVIVGFYRPVHKLSGGPVGYCFIKVDKEVAENILKKSSLTVNNVKIFAEVSSQSEVKLSPVISSTKQPGYILTSFHTPSSPEEYKVMFRDVPQMASYDVIKEHFQEYGRLHKVFLKNRKGFVIFASRDGLEQALSTRHTILGSEVKLSHSSLVSQEAEEEHHKFSI